METPLYTALKRHWEKGRAPFHTPGHKGDLRALPEDLLHLDFTELPDTDSLFEACGPIDAAEKAAARLFRSARTLFSAGGCSLCIQAMLRLACPRAGQTVPVRAQRPPFGRADDGAFGAYTRLGDAVGFGGHAFGFHAHL